MKPRSTRFQTCASTFAILSLASWAHGALSNYTGANGGIWTTGSNWSGAAVPVIGDDVTVGNNTSSGVLSMVFNTSYTGAGLNSLNINAATASTFTVTQSGAGTTMISQSLTLGTTTFGAIYDQSNGAATFTTMNIGTGSAGQGLYQLSNLGNLSVGTLNLGGASVTNGGNRLTQTGGTSTITSVLTIGTIATTGTYNLSGGTLNVNGVTGMRVGFGGAGTFNHSAGTVNMGANPIDIGSFSGGTGTYNLSGTGQINSRSVNLAGRSTTLFSQTGGTHTIGSAGNGFLEIGDSGATKDATYSLSAGTLQVNGNILLNGSQTSSGNSARLLVSGGTATATGSLTVNAVTAGLTAGVTVSGTGQLGVNSLSLGGLGTNSFTQSAGTFSTTQGATVTSLAGGTTTYTQSGGTSSFGNSFTVTGASATTASLQGGSLNAPQIVISATGSGTAGFDVSGSGSVTAPVLFLGFFAGGTSNNFNQSGGTVTISSGASIGTTSTPSTYILSGTGAFNPNNLTVGVNVNGGGNGTIQQSGGTLTTSSLILGRFAGDTGNYVLSGGTLTGTGGPLTLAGNVGFLGTGNFTQTGGSASFGLLTVGVVSGSSGVYTLSGTGVLNATLTQVGSGPGTDGIFTQTGGTHTAGVSVMQGGSYALSGGTLTVPNSATGLVNRGTFTMSGGTSNGGFTNDGQFTYSGGTFNGSLLNNGAVTLNASLIAGAGVRNNATIAVNSLITLGAAASQTLDNSGTISLAGGSLAGAGAIVNNALITGYGTLGGTAGFTNNALITGSGGNLNVTATSFTNNGNIGLATGLQLQLNGSTFSNNGSVSLNSGSLIGSATFINAGGGSVVGPGLISAPFSSSGSVEVSSGTLNIAGAWSNTGVVTVAGLTASISGGAISNTGTIQGFGNVASANNQSGGTVEAIGGTLRVTSLTNVSGGLITASTGGKVVVSAGLATNAGVISLSGGTFDNNGNAMNNTGQITGYGTVRTGSTGLTNNGSMTFAGGNSTVNGNVTNSVGRTIRVNYSSTTFTGNVVNNGIIKNTGGTIIFTGSYTENGTYISDPADNYFTDITVGAQGALVGGEGDRFFVSGDLFSSSTQTQAWQTSLAELQFAGGDGSHLFSINGQDLGVSPLGFTGNFSWGILGLALGETLNFVDEGDNGGALYVGTLDLDGGLSQLSSIYGNGMNLYYDLNAVGNTYLNGGSYLLSGGGWVMPIPEPSSSLLVSGALMILATRRRRVA